MLLLFTLFLKVNFATVGSIANPLGLNVQTAKRIQMSAVFAAVSELQQSYSLLRTTKSGTHCEI